MAAISLIMLLSGTSAGDGFSKVKRADRFAMIFELVMLALFLVTLGAAAQTFLHGSMATLFWGGLVVVGLLVPLALEFTMHGARALGVISAVLVLVGGFILRYVMVMSVHV